MKNSYEVEPFTVDYDEYVLWTREVGIYDGATLVDADNIGRGWFVSEIILEEEDYIAFRLRFGV